MDLVIEGKAFINNAFEKCCIGIENGKIIEIKKILKCDKKLDFGNKLILPAGVDMHVHFRDPGLTNKEDFLTGSTAAAFGGITCVFDMPNTIPQTTNVQTIAEKISSAENKSLVDFGVYAGITNSNINNIESLSKSCSGFKIYLGTSTNSLKFNKVNLREALHQISTAEKSVLFHAEDEELLTINRDIENDITDHLRIRPSICEETSIKDILIASQRLNLKVHICHLSSLEGLEILKSRSNNITCGVTPHHILLSAEKNIGTQTFYKVNPPLRSSFDKESLFNAVRNGNIDVIESDHAPHTKEEKDTEFNEAPSGLPGVETMFPLFLYLAKKEKISFQRIISLLSRRPAEILDIPKGKIENGKDADFIIIDLKDETKIRAECLHSKCGWTPFEDWPAIFPSHVFIRGEKLIEDSTIQVKQGFGKFVGA
jgi:dihydroorotase